MDERWIWAAVAAIAGLVVAAVVGVLIRRVLDRPSRREALREIAGPLSIFVFWVLVAAGVLVAVAVSSPDRLETIPTDLLQWLPNLAIAGLLLIGGYALGLTFATAIGRALSRVSGSRNRGLERAVRATVLAGASILALNQIGVDTTVVDLLIAAVVFAVAAIFGGLSILGGRKTAEHVAAGRALGQVLEVGATVECGEVAGVIVELLPVHLVIENERGRLLVPYGAVADSVMLIRPDEAGTR